MKNKLKISIIFTSAIIIISIYLFQFRQPKEAIYKITQSVAFQNISASSISPSYLVIHIPLTNERQKTEFISFEPNNCIVNKNANKLTITGFESIPPNQLMKISYSFKTIIYNRDSYSIDSPLPSDAEPEQEIESNDSLILKASKMISSGLISKEKKAYSFYQYITKNISFDENVGNSWRRSAKECLIAKAGVCGNKANLLTALCRASGIPARSISGLVLPRRSKNGFNTIGSHAWNEIYLNGKWIFADPTYGKNFLMNDKYWGKYDMFRAIIDKSTNSAVFKSELSDMDTSCFASCIITGPACLFFALKKDSPDSLIIRGNEMHAKVEVNYR